VYARRVADRELTFDFAEGLLEDNLLMVDRETGSVWSQLAGQAVDGDLEGTPLRALPSLQTTWGFWRRQHPDTRVMVRRDRSEGAPYLYQEFEPGTRRRRQGDHDVSTLGLGLVLADEAWFFPLDALAGARTPLRRQIDGRTVVIHHDPDGLTAWATDGDGEQLVTYESGWRSFYPETRVFRPE